MIVLTESGLDPGLDHLLAQELVARAQRSTGAALAEDAAGDAANGKRIYAKLRCFTCHGRAGQGGAYNYPAPALASSLELPRRGFPGIPA
jgi:mono/diheme cytochrome c family protein